MRTILLLACLLGCSPVPASVEAPPGAPAAAAMQMRSWPLPAGVAPVLADAIDDALRIDRDLTQGQAIVGPGGSLVVVATPSVLEGVEALIAQAVASPAPAPRNVELSYWLVTGSAGEPSRSAGLDAVSEALDVLRSSDGVDRFELLSSRTLRTLDGSPGELEGGTHGDAPGHLAVEQRVTIEPGGDAVIAWIDIDARFGDRSMVLSSKMLLVPGKTTVLSQLGGDDDNAYLLVRAAVQPQ